MQQEERDLAADEGRRRLRAGGANPLVEDGEGALPVLAVGEGVGEGGARGRAGAELERLAVAGRRGVVVLHAVTGVPEVQVVAGVARLAADEVGPAPHRRAPGLLPELGEAEELAGGEELRVVGDGAPQERLRALPVALGEGGVRGAQERALLGAEIGVGVAGGVELLAALRVRQELVRLAEPLELLGVGLRRGLPDQGEVRRLHRACVRVARDAEHLVGSAFLLLAHRPLSALPFATVLPVNPHPSPVPGERRLERAGHLVHQHELHDPRHLDRQRRELAPVRPRHHHPRHPREPRRDQLLVEPAHRPHLAVERELAARGEAAPQRPPGEGGRAGEPQRDPGGRPVLRDLGVDEVEVEVLAAERLGEAEPRRDGAQAGPGDLARLAPHLPDVAAEGELPLPRHGHRLHRRDAARAGRPPEGADPADGGVIRHRRAGGRLGDPRDGEGGGGVRVAAGPPEELGPKERVGHGAALGVGGAGEGAPGEGVVAAAQPVEGVLEGGRARGERRGGALDEAAGEAGWRSRRLAASWAASGVGTRARTWRARVARPRRA